MDLERAVRAQVVNKDITWSDGNRIHAEIEKILLYWRRTGSITDKEYLGFDRNEAFEEIEDELKQFQVGGRKINIFGVNTMGHTKLGRKQELKGRSKEPWEKNLKRSKIWVKGHHATRKHRRFVVAGHWRHI